MTSILIIIFILMVLMVLRKKTRKKYLNQQTYRRSALIALKKWDGQYPVNITQGKSIHESTHLAAHAMLGTTCECTDPTSTKFSKLPQCCKEAERLVVRIVVPDYDEAILTESCLDDLSKYRLEPSLQSRIEDCRRKKKSMLNALVSKLGENPRETIL